MKNINRILLTLLIVHTVVIPSSTLVSKRPIPSCKQLFVHYSIREELKSYKGWKRVCLNDKIQLYTKLRISPIDKAIMCNCFSVNNKARDINNLGGQQDD